MMGAPSLYKGTFKFRSPGKVREGEDWNQGINTARLINEVVM